MVETYIVCNIPWWAWIGDAIGLVAVLILGIIIGKKKKSKVK